MIKLNLGCGIHHKPGYINIDQNQVTVEGDQSVKADVVCDAKNTAMIAAMVGAHIRALPGAIPIDTSEPFVDEIFAGHLLEHMNKDEHQPTVSGWYDILKPEGKLVVVVPDILVAIDMFHSNRVDWEKMHSIVYGRPEPGMQHLYAFNDVELCDILEKAGFRAVEPLDATTDKRLVSNVPWQFGFICTK